MRRQQNAPVILALEIGAFPYRTDANASLEFALRNLSELDSRKRQTVRKLYVKGTVHTRHLAIPDFVDGTDNGFFSSSLRMPVEQRLDSALEIASPLVVETAEKAILNAGVKPNSVGQLVFVTSTAMGSPSLDRELVKRLGLPQHVHRSNVNFMGCAAGITGLRWACDYVKGLDTEHTQLVSLVVCLEMSSLHSTMDSDPNNIITHSLFSDGVACAVVGHSSIPRNEKNRGVNLALVDFQSLLFENIDDGIRLKIQTDGIACLLSPRLPDSIPNGVKKWTAALLDRTQERRKALAFFAIHPGGSKIIEKSVEGLEVPDECARHSWETLREYGNVLSCGVFFVLRRMLDTNAITPGDMGIAFSFSPGVSMEGVLLKALPPEPVANMVQSLRIKKRNGAILPAWTSDTIIQDLEYLHLGLDDVIVASYPKAGTTWMLQIVHLLLQKGLQGNVPLNHAIGWLERDSVDKIDTMIPRRLIKTHIPLNLLQSIGGKRIYVVRNPKDLAVSYYYHARAKEDFGFTGNWQQFFELFLAGKVEGGDWWEHTRSGIAQARRCPDTTLLLCYEDIRRDTYAAVRRIALFLEIPVTDTLVDIIVERSSLHSMRSSFLTNVQWSRQREGEAPHLRCGAVGEWETLFTQDQELALESRWAEFAARDDVILPGTPADLKNWLNVNVTYPCSNADTVSCPNIFRYKGCAARETPQLPAS